MKYACMQLLEGVQKQCRELFFVRFESAFPNGSFTVDVKFDNFGKSPVLLQIYPFLCLIIVILCKLMKSSLEKAE